MDCLFCKFASGEIPKEFVYEDEDIMVFPDIHPVKPIHLLVMPKRHLTDFMSLDDDILLGKVRKVIQNIIKKEGLTDKGFRIVVNGGGAQAIDHLHFHVYGPLSSAAAL